MSNTFGKPGQDLAEPILSGQGDNYVMGRPDGGDRIGNDLPTKLVETNPANETIPRIDRY